MIRHPDWEFYHFLATEFGCHNVRKMLSEMDSIDITNWMAYYTVKNFKEKQRLDQMKSRRGRRF